MGPQQAIALTPTTQPDAWDRLLAAMPATVQDYLRDLQYADWLVAILLLGAGLVFLLQGWRIFRIWVIVNAGMLGVLVGDRVGTMLQGPYMPLWCSIGGGILLALLAWPLMKYAVGLIGALTGGLVGHAAIRYFAAAMNHPGLAGYAWAGAIGGGVVLALSAFFLLRMGVIITTSLQGATMIVSGVLSLLLKHEPIREPIIKGLTGNAHLLPVLIGVPALIGLLFQSCTTSPPHKRPKPE
ncbi:MAG TPA: hypothetical protein VNA25_04545 [Phycisphaerae bacterium]|nr:hypothetical protein [Phycisphaerae bacterium]